MILFEKKRSCLEARLHYNALCSTDVYSPGKVGANYCNYCSNIGSAPGTHYDDMDRGSVEYEVYL